MREIEIGSEEWLRRVNAYLNSRMGEVAEGGWFVQHVADGPASFSYTVGLSALHHPELIIDGLPFGGAQVILDELAGRVAKEDHTLSPDGIVEVSGLPAIPLYLLLCDDVEDFSLARRFYGEEVSGLQVCWPDENGRMFFEPDFDPKFAYVRIRGSLESPETL